MCILLLKSTKLYLITPATNGVKQTRNSSTDPLRFLLVLDLLVLALILLLDPHPKMYSYTLKKLRSTSYGVDHE